MREILLTSSVLILALLVLRRVFRQKISRRVQYALWGLVLVRLLAPVSLPALDFSVLSVAEPVQEAVTARLEAPAFTAPVIPITNPQTQPQSPYPAAQEPTIPNTSARPAEVPADEPAARELTVTEVLGIVWLTGAAAMTVWLLASNLRFAIRLRNRRISVKIPGSQYRVYMVESGLASPCLFGILRPAIYLTPSAVTSEASLRHVLAHEETHARHLDPLWSLLRSVCLTVYWFDPLVWIAASASRTDCELACDEGAIRRLGEGERLAYGRTLLSLIPIKRLPGNPLLSATTMSSDKKRLRDRVTRIAENRKTRKLALCAMALLTAGACVLTFAGCSEGTAKPDAPVIVEKEDGPITATELRYFNEQYFNGNSMNIRNQFLSSLYNAPADIDLYDLFYNGTGGGEGITEEERTAYEEAGGFVDCDIVKLTPAGMDEVLLANTGLTLEETSKTGLGSYTYLPEYDAYYSGHGDTNYRMSVNIAAGTREGELLHLYYNDDFYADGWKCVTLRETADSYQFVSNAYSEKPVVPTVYPEGDPLLSISLADLEGTEPKAVEMRHHSNDCEERLAGIDQSWNIGGHHIQGYRATNGVIYVAEITENMALSDGTMTWEADCFFVAADENFYIKPFDDLFGWDGFSIHHISNENNLSAVGFNTFDEDGTLFKLYSCLADGASGLDTQIIDLNGDGVNELLVTDGGYMAQLAFLKDGLIYVADVSALLQEAWPEAENLYFSGMAPYARCLTAQALVPMTAESGAEYNATAFRNIYFDGENLLVYKQDRTAVDHVLPGVTGPEAVLGAVRDYMEGTYLHRDDLKGAEVDDWRIAGLEKCAQQDIDSISIDIYRYYAEVHAAAPEYVFLSRGMMSMDEDGWVSSEYPGSDYVCFRVDEDGAQTYLVTFTDMDSWPGDEQFEKDLKARLVQEGFLQANPGDAVQAVWDTIRDDGSVLLTLETADGEGGAYSMSMAWNVPSDLLSGYTWERVPEPQSLLTANGGLLTVNGDRNTLIFSEDPSLVCWMNASGTTTYRVTYTGEDDIFGCELFERMRNIYDEAELRALMAAAPVIPDDGRSREDIAREWVEAYEGAYLNATSGSRMKWTYLDIRDVDLDNWDIAEHRLTEYAEARGAQDAFLFSYSSVFVPAGDPDNFMAGNTEEYQGTDAPEGALQWWHCGYMYLLEDGWHCDGTGTGP